ncbi:methylenetetrahydrofolate reductase [NAD(P)H] [Microbulbifer flavimaris]|uniref:Methylenetetrahydrofolate reductase n=1 Tax=Microbulbifer flavimaris TaxID=1781068 RepID=A0ABX4I0J7_9GAMM|nr:MULTISPECIES: methylenetetrahydrofolate reductase [NAD(P)H] [Microbulbifer]KUJ83752.1 5,10-methylenetetrahydrofolate reductase [Microbulbifer sp. ZGT114]PCO05925.1 methylenetetrahydrofolate reductase [NAD(P)H] [Microbulbifer flavimaris]
MTNNTRISFEFFPPKTPEGREKLYKTRETLQEFQPAFFSVTYGAGGTTRETTADIVTNLRRDGISIAPHLSFGGDNEETVQALLNRYQEAGVDRIVALRGDMPSGMGAVAQLVYANELVAFIRRHSGDHFHLEVAAYPEIHPEAESYDADIGYLKGKFDAGANSALTQYFYNPDAYFYFLDQCEKAGIDAPIYPGIMPITNFTNLARFSKNCGAEIPRWLRQRMESFSNPEDIRKLGLEVVTDLCETLLEGGAPGLHFYTMNQVEPTAEILRSLSLD